MTCITDTTSSDRQVNLIIMFTERARFTKKTKPTLLDRDKPHICHLPMQWYKDDRIFKERIYSGVRTLSKLLHF